MKAKKRISVWQMLALLYLGGTIIGSLFLILPFATRDGEQTSYLGALFTAASAVSLTGLAPYDTAVHWSLFGQLTILVLVQMSGLGFMTLVSSAFIVFGRAMSMGNRDALMLDSRGARSGLKVLLLRIVVGTAVCETVGALLLMVRFIPDFGAGKGVYYAIWHSISAFCNAGFDLMGSQASQFISLTAYVKDPLVTLTVCALVILGGLGFCVWGDMLDCKLNFKKYQLNTKVVLVVNVALILIGAGLFALFERNTYDNFNFGELLLASLASSVLPRSAGIATTNTTAFSESGYLLTLLLMFIGGGSGSTAGGIRVGTFAVIIMGMIAEFRGRRDINIGKKRIDYSLLAQSLAILTAYLVITIVSTLLICTIEPNSPSLFKAALFECVSAIGSVGLSMSLTPSLSVASQIIIILLMYAGRVGILNLALALGQTKTTAEIRRPIDNLLIG